MSFLLRNIQHIFITLYYNAIRVDLSKTLKAEFSEFNITYCENYIEYNKCLSFYYFTLELDFSAHYVT